MEVNMDNNHKTEIMTMLQKCWIHKNLPLVFLQYHILVV